MNDDSNSQPLSVLGIFQVELTPQDLPEFGDGTQSHRQRLILELTRELEAQAVIDQVVEKVLQTSFSEASHE